MKYIKIKQEICNPVLIVFYLKIVKKMFWWPQLKQIV